MGRSLEYWTSWPIIGCKARKRRFCSFWRHAATGLFPSRWSFFKNCTRHTFINSARSNYKRSFDKARWKLLAQHILLWYVVIINWTFIYVYMHVYVVNCCNWFWSSWKGLSNLSLLFCFPCQFLYRGSEVPPCSARNVPGFGWRHAFGSNHPPPGVIDQANGL